MTTPTLTTIPTELLAHIISKLPAKDVVLSVQLVNKLFHSIFSQSAGLNRNVEIELAGLEWNPLFCPDLASHQVVPSDQQQLPVSRSSQPASPAVLALLREREEAWSSFDPKYRTRVVVNHLLSGVYDVIQGYYFLGRAMRDGSFLSAGLKSFSLPGSGDGAVVPRPADESQPPSSEGPFVWKDLNVPGKVIRDFGSAIEERDLVVLVTSCPCQRPTSKKPSPHIQSLDPNWNDPRFYPHPTNAVLVEDFYDTSLPAVELPSEAFTAPQAPPTAYFSLQVHLVQFSTGQPHKEAIEPILPIHVYARQSRHPTVSIEVVGENLAIALKYGMGPASSSGGMPWDGMLIWDWKRGYRKSPWIPTINTGLVFLAEGLLVHPNIHRKTLDVYHIEPSPPESDVKLEALAASKTSTGSEAAQKDDTISRAGTSHNTTTAADEEHATATTALPSADGEEHENDSDAASDMAEVYPLPNPSMHFLSGLHPVLAEYYGGEEDESDYDDEEGDDDEDEDMGFGVIDDDDDDDDDGDDDQGDKVGDDDDDDDGDWSTVSESDGGDGGHGRAMDALRKLAERDGPVDLVPPVPKGIDGDDDGKHPWELDEDGEDVPAWLRPPTELERYYREHPRPRAAVMGDMVAFDRELLKETMRGRLEQEEDETVAHLEKFGIGPSGARACGGEKDKDKDKEAGRSKVRLVKRLKLPAIGWEYNWTGVSCRGEPNPTGMDRARDRESILNALKVSPGGTDEDKGDGQQGASAVKLPYANPSRAFTSSPEKSVILFQLEFMDYVGVKPRCLEFMVRREEMEWFVRGFGVGSGGRRGGGVPARAAAGVDGAAAEDDTEQEWNDDGMGFEGCHGCVRGGHDERRDEAERVRRRIAKRMRAVMEVLKSEREEWQKAFEEDEQGDGEEPKATENNESMGKKGKRRAGGDLRSQERDEHVRKRAKTEGRPEEKPSKRKSVRFEAEEDQDDDDDDEYHDAASADNHDSHERRRSTRLALRSRHPGHSSSGERKKPRKVSVPAPNAFKRKAIQDVQNGAAGPSAPAMLPENPIPKPQAAANPPGPPTPPAPPPRIVYPWKDWGGPWLTRWFNCEEFSRDYITSTCGERFVRILDRWADYHDEVDGDHFLGGGEGAGGGFVPLGAVVYPFGGMMPGPGAFGAGAGEDEGEGGDEDVVEEEELDAGPILLQDLGNIGHDSDYGDGSEEDEDDSDEDPDAEAEIRKYGVVLIDFNEARVGREIMKRKEIALMSREARPDGLGLAAVGAADVEPYFGWMEEEKCYKRVVVGKTPSCGWFKALKERKGQTPVWKQPEIIREERARARRPGHEHADGDPSADAKGNGIGDGTAATSDGDESAYSKTDALWKERDEAFLAAMQSITKHPLYEDDLPSYEYKVKSGQITRVYEKDKVEINSESGTQNQVNPKTRTKAIPKSDMMGAESYRMLQRNRDKTKEFNDGGVFSKEVISTLPYLEIVSKEKFNYEAISIDEERILGFRVNDDGGMSPQWFDVLYFG